MKQYVEPSLKKDYPVYANRLREKDGKESSIWWYLRLAVENTKIKVSKKRQEECKVKARISIEGQTLRFECDLNEQKVATAMAPVLYRSLTLIDTLIEKNGYINDVRDLDRVILVGGPTLSPVLIETLRGEYHWTEDLVELIEKEDRKKALERLNRGFEGVMVDNSIDAITAVARGAALYAENI
ncbi:MAG TPA: hypothetical protein EYP78_01055, partial [Candidatus Omnitrophica bacterium]|nr:hypothetical protein [Candidatus Omnitrophota bacterium]